MDIKDQMDMIIRKALTSMAVSFAEAAQDEAPVITGNLAHSIHVGELICTGGDYSIEVGIDPSELSGDVNYAIFVHDGTGIYGPKGKRIVPRNSKALKTPFGFKKSIAGQKANPFFTRAWDSDKKRLLELFNTVVAQELVNFRLINEDKK